MSGDPVISTKDVVGDYDAIATAKPGEPLFPIQGGDPFGPPTVLHWVSLYRAAGLAEDNPTKAKAMLRKAADAEIVAWAMTAYQKGHADTIAGARANYADSSPAQAIETHNERSTRIKSASTLYNLLSQIAGVANTLGMIGILPYEQACLHGVVTELQRISEIIEPRRGKERS